MRRAKRLILYNKEEVQKGKIIENIKFLIKQYEKDIENKNNEFLPEEIEDFENIIIELKFILELEGIDYE